MFQNIVLFLRLDAVINNHKNAIAKVMADRIHQIDMMIASVADASITTVSLSDGTEIAKADWLAQTQAERATWQAVLDSL